MGLALSSSFLMAQSSQTPLYKNALAPIDARVKDLIGRMTLEEKVLQLSQSFLGINDNENNLVGAKTTASTASVGSMIYIPESVEMRNKIQKQAMEETRLGIPVLFAYDVIHGFRTIYPIGPAQACSWDLPLVEKAFSVAAQEARMSGIDWVFAPMIDIARDGRWGRISEGYGEDPYTTSRFAVAAVRGFQGEDNNFTSNHKVAACLKHYVGYGAEDGGRDYGYTELSRQTLWDTYLPPYEAAIKAGAATVMSSFNNISGIPATIHKYLLTEVLKEKWGFKGFVVSDWAAVEQLVNQNAAADRKDATRLSIQAGLDMDMTDGCYQENLQKLVEEGVVDVKYVDEALSRVLTLKFKLGLFEKPYTPVYKDAERILLPESRQIASKLAEESYVLLKNESGTLPLSAKKIAVIGPMVKNQKDLLGAWSGKGKSTDVETIWDGLQKEFGADVTLSYAAGCKLDGNDRKGFAEAVSLANQSEVVLLCLGEKAGWSGENASRSTIALPQIQIDLLTELSKAGKPIVLVLSSGRPIELGKIEHLCQSIIEIWQPGIAGGTPLAGILSGRINPSGKLCLTFPYSTGQIPTYYNERNRARRGNQGTYQDIPTDPLYTFAHGLSYTTYSYGELKSEVTNFKRNQTFKVTVPVTNSGDREGVETVHWFISDPVCSITRPKIELKSFERQSLKPGETKVFTFEVIPMRDLSFVNEDGERFLEKGVYYIQVKDKKLKIELTD